MLKLGTESVLRSDGNRMFILIADTFKPRLGFERINSVAHLFARVTPSIDEFRLGELLLTNPPEIDALHKQLRITIRSTAHTLSARRGRCLTRSSCHVLGLFRSTATDEC